MTSDPLKCKYCGGILPVVDSITHQLFDILANRKVICMSWRKEAKNHSQCSCWLCKSVSNDIANNHTNVFSLLGEIIEAVINDLLIMVSDYLADNGAIDFGDEAYLNRRS